MKHWLATAASLIVIAVATPLSSSIQAQPGPPCSGTSHCVDVTIVNGEIQHVANVVVSGKNHQIYWHIRTAGYTFPPAPHPITIAFKEPSSINDNGLMPANEFPCNRVTATQVHCTNKNSTHGKVRSYQYAITVLDANGNKVIADPWVVNY